MFTLKSPRTLKFVLPLLALIVVAVTTFAFRSNTTPNRPLVNDKVYQFTGDATDADAVRDLANWEYIESASPCSDIEQPKACTIVVDATHATNATLAGSGISITALNDLGNGSTYRVSEAVDGTYNATAFNQEQ
ncbi:hypothetical protein LQ567_24235 [Niabella pedocola]|uniref:Uncharacterized protein n=1 Tax=Niabella pedocola TaxID=1752077 RepID=A0ABS8PYN5_9BACT|nr:hypothetical protein [Niabella pedocola]MCD2425914.1 hypothetical protein [Niabella pedocola]